MVTENSGSGFKENVSTGDVWVFPEIVAGGGGGVEVGRGLVVGEAGLEA